MIFRVSFLVVMLFAASGQMRAQSLSVDSLERELKKASHDTTKVNLYRMLAGTLLNSDPGRALEHAKAGIALGRKIGYDKGVAGCYLNLAVVFNAASRIDSFVVYTESAIVWAEKVNEPNRLALAYLNRADAYLQLRNLKQSLLDCERALYYAGLADNNDRRARIYQTIGTVYYSQDKYTESKEYYERASKLYQEDHNYRMYAIILNNLGNIYKRTGQHDIALKNYHQAIEFANKAGDIVNLSMYYSNISSLYNYTKQYKKAEASAKLALQHATDGENEVQQADAYYNFAVSFLNRRQYKEAIEAGRKAFTMNGSNGLIEEQSDAAILLADAYAANGNYKDASYFYKTGRELNDALLKKKYDEEIAFLQTSLRVEEKNNEIALLTKDKMIQEQNLSRHRILIAGSLLIALLAVAAIFLLINRQRLKQSMKELQLRNEIASDLHDEVGSSLSSIHMLSGMASSERSDTLQQKDILKKVNTYSKETMEKMSDIVWMIQHMNPDDKSLSERMKYFLTDICKSKNIESYYNVDESVLNRLNIAQRKTVYLVFKEALNNAAKYSSASKITVSLRQTDKQLEMTVADNGAGFEDTSLKKGNGLRNMRNRAIELKGSTTIASMMPGGTTVTMTFPI